nr:nucleotidyltransferase domain-containing protein [uncultured Schaedlerella sp.]
MKTMVKAREQAMKRLYGLLELQKDLEQRFDPNQYNIFVFGSYITVNYIEGVSDIDVAVYTEDFDLYKKISLYIEEYFEKRQVKSDIFRIFISYDTAGWP